MPPAPGSSLNSASRAMAAWRSGWAGMRLLWHHQAPCRLAGDPPVPDRAPSQQRADHAGAQRPADEGALAVAVLEVLGARDPLTARIHEDQVGVGAHLQAPFGLQTEPTGREPGQPLT